MTAPNDAAGRGELPAAAAPAPETLPDLAAPDEAPPRKPVVLGDFVLVRRLGRGAMGTVYLARQVSLGRDAAVKVPFPHVARQPLFLRRFRREGRVMARLSHPNIVQCYGAGVDRGRHFLAMEYVDGRDLGRWLAELGRLATADALAVVLGCAAGLGHLHDRGLVHRDVKPDNLLVGCDGAVKLADLGLARACLEDLSLTRTGRGAGTPVYIAPEQARSAKHADPRSDVYALGCMLYHLLTGQVPFPGETLADVLLAKVYGRYEPASRVNPAVPPALERVLDRMLARFPEQRYATCADVVRALRALELTDGIARFAAPGAAALPARVVPPDARPDDGWYVFHRGGDGAWRSRKMTAEQIREATRDLAFRNSAQVSRTPQGEFTPLAQVVEFAALAGRRERPQDPTAAPSPATAPRFWTRLLRRLRACRS